MKMPTTRTEFVLIMFALLLVFSTVTLANENPFSIIHVGEYSEGLAPIQTKVGLWGYINENNEMVVTPQYDEAYKFVNGQALVLTMDSISSYYAYMLIDRNGDVISTPLEFDAWEYSGINKIYGLLLFQDKSRALIERHLTGKISSQQSAPSVSIQSADEQIHHEIEMQPDIQSQSTDNEPQSEGAKKPTFKEPVLPETEPVLRLVNKTGYDMYHVYISPSRSDSWGKDLLGKNEVVYSGQAIDFYLQPDIYDIRVLDNDYDAYFKWNVYLEDDLIVLFTISDLE